MRRGAAQQAAAMESLAGHRRGGIGRGDHVNDVELGEVVPRRNFSMIM